MGDIGKKISDFFSGLMPKDEEPPTSARWSERTSYGGGAGLSFGGVAPPLEHHLPSKAP